MKRFQRGLVVGKFAPLHRGHELVIRTALEQCERVTLLSYANPEPPGCEPARRRSWLGALFPECQTLVLDHGVPLDAADENVHRRFVGKVCREHLGASVDAVFTSEDYGEGFALELTGFFRETEPNHPAVQHVNVDRARVRSPISGTAIRADVHAHRRWLAPVVYASFVGRVCLLGGESSGKTTLAETLAAHFGTQWVPEYGRELWVRKQGNLTFDDLVHIAREQIEREERALLCAYRFLFCDTSPLTTAFYSHDLFGRVDPELTALAKREYACTVLCAPDFPFVQDGTRRDAEFRRAQHAFYRTELERRGIAYVVAEGTLAQRVDAVASALTV
jgi:HTH-type transcriptional repressor of NAD biosynthesis genes